MNIHKKNGQIEVELQGVFCNDRMVAESAWTSSLTNVGKNTRTDEDVKRVVNLLANERHSVPFESVVFRFWIKMPITADRQHVTHRIASHNGMSGRYRTMPSEFYNITQDVTDILEKANMNTTVAYGYESICRQANSLYKEFLKDLKDKEKAGVISNKEYKRAREFLRGMLPQNNMTERVTTINLRSVANYIKLRNSEHAQNEIRQVAEMMLECMKECGVCPVALEALERNGWNI